MQTDLNARSSLSWLVKVRIITITFLLGIGMVIIRLTKTNVSEKYFLTLIVLWYTIAVLFVALSSLSGEFKLQARLQIFTDLVFCTAVIYITGGIDTYFNFLYPLLIIVASILLPRWWAYLTAALSFICFGGILELSYFEIIRSFSISRPDLKSLQAVILVNLAAYLAIAHLASDLSKKLRQIDVRLHDKSGQLENLKSLHENIINSMRGGLITTGMDGRIELLNASAEKLLERDAAEVRGLPVARLFSDRLPDVHSENKQGEVRCVTPSGEQKTFALMVSALTVPERGTLGHVYTFDDLSDIRRLEREVRMRERLAAVGRMASGIAHEIRNPLASIAGSVKILAGISALSEDQHTLVNIVTRESERLNSIISDFLSYSREKSYMFASTDLVRLLDETLTLLENRPEPSGAKYVIERNLAADRALTRADGDKIKQVFWNLSENAIRAMPAGGRLTVSLSLENRWWQIRFADTGHGITAQQAEKLFEPFQSGFTGGTGLGLAIVYQIVQAHSGKISARSLPGEGAEFVLQLQQEMPAIVPGSLAAMSPAPPAALPAEIKAIHG